MPTYEYRCPDCGRVEYQKAPIDKRLVFVWCIECGGRMTKVITAPAVIFKGDGFYSSRRKRALKKELDRRTEEKQK